MTKLYAFFRHNSCTVIGLFLCCCVLLWCYSCQSTVVSLIDPGARITRAQLVLEVDTYLSNAELQFSDLDRQDFVKNTIFNSVLDLAQCKSINPIGIAIALSGILGLGAIGDNIRKRTHINTLKGSSLDARIKEGLKKILVPEEN